MGTPLVNFRLKSAEIKFGSYLNFFPMDGYFAKEGYKIDLAVYKCNNWQQESNSSAPPVSFSHLIEKIKERGAETGFENYLKEIRCSKNKLSKAFTEYNSPNCPERIKTNNRGHQIDPSRYLLLREAFPDHIENIPLGEVIVDILEIHPDYGGVPAPVEVKHVYYLELLENYAIGAFQYPKGPYDEPLFEKWFDGYEKDCLINRNYNIINHERNYLLPGIKCLEVADIQYDHTLKTFHAKKVDPVTYKLTDVPTEIKDRSWYSFFIDSHKDSSYIESDTHTHVSFFWRVKLIMHPYFCNELIKRNRLGVWHEGYN